MQFTARFPVSIYKLLSLIVTINVIHLRPGTPSLKKHKNFTRVLISGHGNISEFTQSIFIEHKTFKILSSYAADLMLVTGI